MKARAGIAAQDGVELEEDAAKQAERHDAGGSGAGQRPAVPLRDGSGRSAATTMATVSHDGKLRDVRHEREQERADQPEEERQRGPSTRRRPPVGAGKDADHMA